MNLPPTPAINLPALGVNLLPRDGEVLFFPGCFSATESEVHLGHLVAETAWRHEPIVLFGKSLLQPRLTAWYGDPDVPYAYSGVTMQPTPWSSTLLDLKSRIECQSGASFNSVLLNFYRDERDSVAWHRDDEPELGANPTIASVSFGATRTFKLRHVADRTLKFALDLTPGSLLLMRAETQHFWEHCIEKRPHPVAPRVNLTFRWIQR